MNPVSSSEVTAFLWNKDPHQHVPQRNVAYSLLILLDS
jgi:hypothetical protein